jgi:hypothetical protein
MTTAAVTAQSKRVTLMLKNAVAMMRELSEGGLQTQYVISFVVLTRFQLSVLLIPKRPK